MTGVIGSAPLMEKVETSTLEKRENQRQCLNEDWERSQLPNHIELNLVCQVSEESPKGEIYYYFST